LINPTPRRPVARDILPAVQQALGDLFRVERELGRGGGARVFLATDQAGQQVALKVLHPELLVTVAAERFLREVRLAGKLDHPHIASVIDSGERDWVVYYTMAYIEGPTLRQALDRVRILPVADAAMVADQLLDALGHAHSHGIIHRDVKPENVIVSHGKVVLVDFGIARAILASANENLTRSGMALGTCTYMSPEQIRGERTIDHRSDIYSTGSLIFECLTGRPPFSHKIETMVLQKVLTEEPPPVQSLRPDTPASLARAIDRALRKEPAERWQSADEMREALTGARV
jgi:serine/threonine-protein kinase